MKHLHDAEFVDLIEGTLAAERVAHAKACEACRAQVDAMRSTIASALVDPQPEPPEVFWQHFATRINAAIDTAPAPARRWWSVPRFAVATAATLLIGLAVVNYVRPQPSGSAPVVQEAAVPAAEVFFIGLDDLDADEGWAVVRAAAAGLTAAPGAVERVAAQLTDAERAELVRLVEDELKRSGA